MYQARELVAQRNILGDEIGTVLENSSCNGESVGELEGHSTALASARMSRESQQNHARTK
jgi:hypothetical protein